VDVSGVVSGMSAARDVARSGRGCDVGVDCGGEVGAAAGFTVAAAGVGADSEGAGVFDAAGDREGVALTGGGSTAALLPLRVM